MDNEEHPILKLGAKDLDLSPIKLNHKFEASSCALSSA